MRLGVSRVHVVAFTCGLALLTGCEWGSDSDGFNTGRGAGAQINISGNYRGYQGDLVAGKPVTSFLLQQVGDSVTVTDSNGSVYEGRVGSPGVTAMPDLSGNYSAGSTLLQTQVE